MSCTRGSSDHPQQEVQPGSSSIDEITQCTPHCNINKSNNNMLSNKHDKHFAPEIQRVSIDNVQYTNSFAYLLA